MRSRTLDSLSLFIGKVFDAGIMFVFNIIAARIVGIEHYGIYVFINSTVMLISIMIKLGLDQGITVLVPREESHKGKAAVVTSGLLMLYGIVIIALSVILLTANQFAATILNDPTYSEYLFYYAPILLILPFTQVAEGVFRSIFKIRYYVIGKSIIMPIGIMGTFLVLYYALGFGGLQALFLCNYVGFGAGALFMVYHMVREQLFTNPYVKSVEANIENSSTLEEQLNTKGNSTLNNKSNPSTLEEQLNAEGNSTLNQLIVISLPLVFLGLHEYLIGRTDAFVIGYFMDEANVGVYNIADKVAYIASFILVASGSIVAPEISKHYHNKEFGHLAQVYHESTKLLVIVNTLVFFGLVIISRWFMDFATNGAGYDGWMVLIFLSLAYLLHSMFGPVAYMNSMTGNQKEEFRIALIMLISNIALDIIFLRYMGIKGIAFATVIVFLIGNLYRTNDMYQKMRIRPSIKTGLIPMAGLGIYLIVRLLTGFLTSQGTFIASLVEAAVYCVLYIVMIYILFISKDEKYMLRRWINKEKISHR